METSISKAGVWTVVSVRGEVDLHHSTDLRLEVVRHLDDGANVLLDMSEVSYIDSSGIAMMAQALSHARKVELDFALVHPTEAVLRILRLTRLDTVFTMYDSVQDASGA